VDAQFAGKKKKRGMQSPRLKGFPGRRGKRGKKGNDCFGTVREEAKRHVERKKREGVRVDPRTKKKKAKVVCPINQGGGKRRTAQKLIDRRGKESEDVGKKKKKKKRTVNGAKQMALPAGRTRPPGKARRSHEKRRCDAG